MKYRFAQPNTVEKKTRRIKSESWKKYTDNLKQLSDTASNKLKDYIVAGHNEQEILDYAYALVTKYGEASSALTCTMYEALAEYSGAAVKAAEPAAVASYWETAKQVCGTMLRTKDAATISASAGRLVKLASVDTMMKNALRDGCEWAWIPAGDSCAFCTMLASRGWVKASEDLIKNGHMSHIHSNCDCTFCVRHDKNVTVEGYDPDALYKEWQDVGDNSKERLNGLRRKIYAENKDQINAQKRATYARRVGKPEDERSLTKRLQFSYNGFLEFIPLHAVIKEPYVIAGKGTDKEIRDVPRLVAVYNKDESEWKKMAGKIRSDKYQFDIHWYESDDQIVREPKIKYMKELKK